MAKRKEQTSLWKYLDACGVLSNGSEEEILLAKKTYWREYQRKYKKVRRSIRKQEIVICLPIELTSFVHKKAKLRGISTPNYIISILEKDVSDLEIEIPVTKYLELKEVLLRIEHRIKEILEKKKMNWLGISKEQEEIHSYMYDMKHTIQTICNTKIPFKNILLEQLESNPNTIILLQEILKRYDYKITYEEDH